VRAFFMPKINLFFTLKFARNAPLKRVLLGEFEGETKKFSSCFSLNFPMGQPLLNTTAA
jgi:hypothetical protein